METPVIWDAIAPIMTSLVTVMKNVAAAKLQQLSYWDELWLWTHGASFTNID